MRVKSTVVRPIETIPMHSPVPNFLEFISGFKQSFGEIYLWTFLSRLTGLRHIWLSICFIVEGTENVLVVEIA